MAPVSPYQTALKLGRPKPDHVTNLTDQERVTAYWTYWDIFRNVEEAFAVVMRDDEGDEVSRRYVPSARTIIEATNRYLAKNPAFVPQSLATLPDGSTVEPDAATVAQIMKFIGDFVKREEVHIKIMSLKRWMLIRGDAVFHLLADDTKPEGTRLRLVEVDPSGYFQVADPIDPARITGVYLVSLIDSDEGDIIAQRQEYRKITTQEEAAEFGAPIGTVYSRLSFYESDGWDDRAPFTDEDLKPVAPPAWAAKLLLTQGMALPAQITSIPVYHYRNNRDGTSPYGTSELQGIETLLAGINQTATDEDISIALMGIGMFYTTSGRPRDEQGNEQPWIISPGVMFELESKEDVVGRVEGAKDINALLAHSGYLEDKSRETTGTPDIAVGRVDVKVAESGIALSIQMAPILSKNQEKELEIAGKTDQMLYDIVNMWLPAYEGLGDPGGVTVLTQFDDPLPRDRKAILDEIVQLVTNKIISVQYAQKLVQERLGYEIPADEFNNLVDEQNQMLDSVGTRLDAEAGGGPPAPEVV